VTPDLAELLRLYEALQDCAPHEEARHQEAFKIAVKSASEKFQLDHWKVSAHVVRQWDIICQRENKRKGVDKGAGM
jgi:hypothetical protein